MKKIYTLLIAVMLAFTLLISLPAQSPPNGAATETATAAVYAQTTVSAETQTIAQSEQRAAETRTKPDLRDDSPPTNLRANLFAKPPLRPPLRC